MADDCGDDLLNVKRVEEVIAQKRVPRSQKCYFCSSFANARLRGTEVMMQQPPESFRLSRLSAACICADITHCGTNSYRGHALAENVIHDRLEARTLLFAGEQGEAIWINADECTFRRGPALQIKALITAATGISPERIMLTATHTHAAHGYTGFDAPAFAAQCIATINRARSRLRPVTHVTEQIGETPPGTLINRRLSLGNDLGDICIMFNQGCSVSLDTLELDASQQVAARLREWGTTPKQENIPDSGHVLRGPVDRRLHLWVLHSDTAEPIAAVARVNAHATTVSQSKVGAVVSADYIRPFGAAIQAALHCPCLVFNGAFGDTRPLTHEYSFAEAERIGTRWAQAALAAAPTSQTATALGGACLPRLSCQLRTDVPHSPAALDTLVQDTKAQLATAASAPARKRLRERLDCIAALRMPGPPQGNGILLPGELEQGALTCEAQAWQLGPLALFCTPGEPFTAQCAAIESRTGHLVVGAANGYISYLPDAAAFRGGDFESTECMLAPEELARLPETAARLCGEVKR